MATVALLAAKASVFDSPEGLVINIPTTKRWPVILFMGFWLCGWVVGESFAIRQLTTSKMPSAARLFLVPWLGAWTVGGCLAIYFWLWNLAGHEVVSLTPTSLAIRREILGFGPSREYDLPNVKNLRVDSAFSRYSFGWSPTSRSMLGGSIAFDYGAKTFRFGSGLDEAEASHLVEVLRSRYPFDAAS